MEIKIGKPERKIAQNLRKELETACRKDGGLKLVR